MSIWLNLTDFIQVAYTSWWDLNIITTNCGRPLFDWTLIIRKFINWLVWVKKHEIWHIQNQIWRFYGLMSPLHKQHYQRFWDVFHINCTEITNCTLCIKEAKLYLWQNFWEDKYFFEYYKTIMINLHFVVSLNKAFTVSTVTVSK